MVEICLNSSKVYVTCDEVRSANKKSYELADKIGAGGNGAVYKCIDQNGDEYAIKFLLHFGKKSKERFRQEIELMKKLTNAYIPHYIDEGYAKVSKLNKDTCSEQAPFVIMDLADSNLLDYLEQNPKISYEEYVPQFRGLCEALKNIHQFAVHRDIKPENILIKGSAWLLSDFGLCEFLNPMEHKDLTRVDEKIGPAFWISPEAADDYYFHKDTIGKYSDVYQLGMIFAFVLLRRYPAGIIDDDNSLNTTKAIKKVIMAAISNDRRHRPQNGEEFLEKFNKATICR